MFLFLLNKKKTPKRIVSLIVKLLIKFLNYVNLRFLENLRLKVIIKDFELKK